MKKIALNIVTPAYFGEMQLSLAVLKSYVLSKNREMDIRQNRFFCEDDSGEIARSIHRQKPDVALFSLYVWTDRKVLDVCARLKELDKNVMIMIGGNVPTCQGKEYLERYDFLDIAVKGEGEETLYRVLEEIHKQNPDFSHIPNLVYRARGSIVETKREDNFNISHQVYPLLLDDFHDAKILYYETSRGCIYKCKYCSYNINFDNRNVMRYYPIEKVKDDLERIFRLPQIKKLLFADSSLIMKRARGLEIVRYLNSLNHKRRIEGKSPVEIALDINLEDLNEEILYELKRLNVFGYGFGLQSIHEDVLKIARRRFRRETFIYYFNRLTEKSGAAINLELMFGLPGDTYDKFRESLEFVIGNLKVHFLVSFRFAVLPGSTFWYERDKYGLVCEEYPPYYVLSTPTFPQQDLEKAERLSFCLQLIYTCFRGIKRLIEREVPDKRLGVYDELTTLIYEEYAHFFQERAPYQEDVYLFAVKLGTPQYAKIKHDMLVDMRRIVKLALQSRSSRQDIVPH